MHTQAVELNKILDSGPAADRYDFSHRTDLSSLSVSIRKEGLMVPPLLNQRKQGDLQIVTGFRRVRALRGMGSDRVDAFVVSGETWTDVDCLRRSILENRWHRGFNEVERARLFTRLQDEFSHLLPSLDDILVDDLKLPRDSRSLAPYRFILTLPETLLNGIALGKISLGQALLLKPFPGHLRFTFYRFMTECELSLQESRQAAEWMLDTSHGEITCPGPENPEEPLASLLAEEGSPGRKTKKLFAAIRKKRFPLLESWQERFDSVRRESGFTGKGIRLLHDPTFETTRIRVQVEAESEPEFSRRIDWISHAVEKGTIRKIFQALSVD